MPQRKIIHLDMDAFFASVEQRDNPSLRGKPVAVAHDGPRSVVATASYEARRFGVRSALPVATARRRCPSIIFVEPRFEVYKEVSGCIRSIFARYTPLIEPLSLDEAFLDVSHHPSATIIARRIKADILAVTGLTGSAGVSVNKMLAKIASDYNKPDGLTVIEPSMVDEFVSRLPVEKFFGIGEVTAARLHRMGIFTGSDLRSRSLSNLVSVFGKAGGMYYNFARGIDNRPVMPDRVRKSVGAETTFETDIDNDRHIRDIITDIARHVWDRATRKNFTGRTVVLKVKYADFKQITRSYSQCRIITSDKELTGLALRLMDSVEMAGHKVRLIGVTLANTTGTTDTDNGLQLTFDFGHGY